MDSVDYNEKNQYFNELKKLFESKENNPDIIFLPTSKVPLSMLPATKLATAPPRLKPTIQKTTLFLLSLFFSFLTLSAEMHQLTLSGTRSRIQVKLYSILLIDYKSETDIIQREKPYFKFV